MAVLASMPCRDHVRTVLQGVCFSESVALRFLALASLCRGRIVWVSERDLYETDLAWFMLSRKQGFPSKDRHTKEYRPLRGGVLTRSQTHYYLSVGVTTARVPWQSQEHSLDCLATSYLNLCTHLNVHAPPLTEIVTLSEPKLKEKISVEGYPCRIGRTSHGFHLQEYQAAEHGFVSVRSDDFSRAHPQCGCCDLQRCNWH